MVFVESSSGPLQLHSGVLLMEFNGFGRVFLMCLLTFLPVVLIGCVC